MTQRTVVGLRIHNEVADVHVEVDPHNQRDGYSFSLSLDAAEELQGQLASVTAAGRAALHAIREATVDGDRS